MAGDWGPDGRFYVGTMTSKLYAVTFDDDYVDTKQVYDGVSNEDGFQILGLAFSPWDAPSPVMSWCAFR